MFLSYFLTVIPTDVGSSFLTTNWTKPPILGVQNLNYWTTREVPEFLYIEVFQLISEDKAIEYHCFASVQFSPSVVSNSFWPHGLQHSRLRYPSPTPGVYLNSCPSHQWCHPTISSSVIPFSSHLQSFPESGSFQMSQLLASGGQSIRVSASASVLPMNIHDWFPLGLTGWISLQSKGLSRVFSNSIVQKHQFFGTQLS